MGFSTISSRHLKMSLVLFCIATYVRLTLGKLARYNCMGKLFLKLASSSMFDSYMHLSACLLLLYVKVMAVWKDTPTMPRLCN